MLMNAQPRTVLNGSRIFVYPHMSGSSYQRVDEMANKDTHAWGAIRPVTASIPATQSWAYGPEDFYDEDKYSSSSTPNFYNQPYEITQYRGQIAANNSNTRVGTHSEIEPREQLMKLRQRIDQPQYDLQNIQSTYGNTAMPMVTSNPPFRVTFDMVFNHAKPQVSYNAFTHGHFHNSGCDCLNPDSSLSTGLSTFSMQELANERDGLGRIKANLGIVNSNFTTGAVASDTTVGLPPVQNSLNGHNLWHNMKQDVNALTPVDMTSSFTFDGLPNTHSSIWPTGSGHVSEWSQRAAPLGTISPQELSLRVPYSNPSSPSPAPNPCLTLTDCNEPPSFSVSAETLQAKGPSRNVPHKSTRPLRPRQKLPSHPINSPYVPPVPTKIRCTSRASKKRSSSIRTKIQASHLNSSQVCVSTDCHESRSVAGEQQHSSAQEIEPTSPPKTKTANINDGTLTWITSVPPDIKECDLPRNAKDEFLVKSKLAGMSYKEIRRKGGFIEAESTLRGRFRTLTKTKSERVRKPEWEDNDIRLLRRAVRKLGKKTESSGLKVPWKQVADYIFEHGGSYRFGNATCRKQWDELYSQADEL